jgi:hypothetical protein
MHKVMMFVGTLLFAAYVVHAATVYSKTCPATGTCASIHLQMLQPQPALLRARPDRLTVALAVHR